MDVLFPPRFGSICRGFLRFMQWYMKKYGVDVGKKKKGAQKEEKQASPKPPHLDHQLDENHLTFQPLS